jgi:subtilisin family serine protease
MVVAVLLLASFTLAQPGLAQSPEGLEQLQAVLASEPLARVVVALHPPDPGADLAVQTQEIARSQAEVLREAVPDGFTPIHQFQTLPGIVGDVTAEGLQKLLEQPAVAAVALDLPVEASLTESEALIKADLVWQDFGLGGAGVNVAVLDTGVDLNHPDLAGRVVAQHCFNRNGGCPGNDAAESDNAQDENGHGTHVTGIIASHGQFSPRGIAPEVGLVIVRVLGPSGSGFSSDVLAGIDWVVANQANLNVKLMNLSLGGGLYNDICDEADANTMLYTSAVAAARQAGITLFAASGNAGQAEGMIAPACVSGVVAVGNVYDTAFDQMSWPTCQDEAIIPDQVACSSNSSSALDLLAPGVLVVSTLPGGSQGSKSGTSVSTPHATAVAALLLQANPALSPLELEIILKETGVPITDARNSRVTPRIDALAAVSRVTGSQELIISGTILLQGRNDHSGVQIFLGQEACPIPGSNNTPAFTTEADGHFEIVVPAGQRYRCLQAVQLGYLVAQKQNPRDDLGEVTLLGGDVTGDDLVNIFDLALIGSRYGTSDPTADLTRDGLVNIIDLVITASNYGREGPVEISGEGE